VKPNSFPELSVQARKTAANVMEVMASPDGATGIFQRVVAFFSLLYAEVAIAF